MTEIIFSDSACGSLKAAQHFGEGKYQNGCISVLVSHENGNRPTKEEIEAAQREAEERARLAWENAIPLGGNPSDVYGFNLAQSFGDISEDQPGVKRKQALELLFSTYPHDLGRQAVREILEKVNKNLKTVRERLATGESLRIWYSNQPDEICGLYWFLEQLNQWKVYGPVSVVKLPEWEIDENENIVQKSCWGEVAAEEWHRYVSLQKPIPPLLIQNCAAYWKELQGENAPLRALLNGKLVSAAETLYDDYILREIAAESDEFQEAMVIGRVIGKYQLGIGDSWIAFRIEEMINEGKLEAISAVPEDMPFYHRMLKKCTR